MSKTLGELRVRTDFNPAASGLVHEIKQSGAAFINLIDKIAHPGAPIGISGSEFGRLKALALTAVEHATSDAVKAATLNPEDYK